MSKTARDGQGEPMADMAAELFVGGSASSSFAELETALVALEQELCREMTSEERAAVFFKQGQVQEKRQDYDAAITAYQTGLTFPHGRWLAYYLRNNLGFCLNFKRRFAEAETWCRGAIAISPEPYNAWKNLGVSLEHQGRPLEATLCYVCAISQGRGEHRSRMHLRRLVQRVPSTGTLRMVRQCFPPEQCN